MRVRDDPAAYALGDRRRVSDNGIEPARPRRQRTAVTRWTGLHVCLSINEFALLHGAGFEPIELVMGVSVYHVGYQFTSIRQQSELAVLTDATYRRPRTRRAPSSHPMTRHTTSGLATVVKTVVKQPTEVPPQ